MRSLVSGGIDHASRFRWQEATITVVTLHLLTAALVLRENGPYWASPTDGAPSALAARSYFFPIGNMIATT
jgi:hypothetical protein